MRLTSYLIETHKKTQLLTEQHDLVLQKVIDAVDHGHVEYGDSKIAFDIGDISDTPKLQGLKLVIRPGKSDEIKLGKNKDGNFAIVISTTDGMPGRQDIDTFLSSRKVYSGLKRAYHSYVKNHHDNDKEYEENDTQKRVAANTRDGFEGSYNDLVSAVREQHKKFTDATAEIDKEMKQIANVGRRKALELAKQKLRDEYLGTSEAEFVSKIMKLPEAEFTKQLDKPWKEKLESRLANFYRSSYSR